MRIGSAGIKAATPETIEDTRMISPPEPQPASDVDLVVASMKHENTSWFETYFPRWRKRIYIVDDPTAPLMVSQNKGHESMVYLTYVYCLL